jgi:Family of unknown function (DUF6412)
MPVIAALSPVFALAAVASGQGPLAVLATLTIAGLLLAAAGIAWAARPGPVPAARVRTALRERTTRTAFLRLRDPAAPGRPLSRAPSA